jgi:hypothetical protein
MIDYESLRDRFKQSLRDLVKGGWRELDDAVDELVVVVQQLDAEAERTHRT